MYIESDNKKNLQEPVSCQNKEPWLAREDLALLFAHASVGTGLLAKFPRDFLMLLAFAIEKNIGGVSVVSPRTATCPRRSRAGRSTVRDAGMLPAFSVPA